METSKNDNKKTSKEKLKEDDYDQKHESEEEAEQDDEKMIYEKTNQDFNKKNPVPNDPEENKKKKSESKLKKSEELESGIPTGFYFDHEDNNKISMLISFFL
jgi:hypothetical protein